MSLFGNLQDLYKNKDHIKFIDDYDTELVTDEKGKVRKKVTYIGPYIPIKTDIKVCRALFILIDILSLASTALILFACVIRHTTGSWLVTMMPLLLSLFPSLYLLSGCILLPMSGAPMKRDRYMHSVIRVFRSSSGIDILMAVVLLAEVAYRAIFRDWLFLRGDIRFLVYIVGAAIINVIIIVLLRRVDLDEREVATRG